MQKKNGTRLVTPKPFCIGADVEIENTCEDILQSMDDFKNTLASISQGIANAASLPADTESNRKRTTRRRKTTSA